MTRMVFINLPIRDLAASKAFYESLGFKNNPQFTDATAACMVWSETIMVMLLTHPKFDSFTRKPRPDAAATTGALYALALESRDAVDAMMAAVAQHGGREYRDTIDMGFMYNRAFADPDGHVWEPFYMDMSQMPKG